MSERPNPPVATTPDSPSYQDDGVVVHWLRYHVVLVTRRRRPFFEDAALAARADELVRRAAEGLGCRVAVCEVRAVGRTPGGGGAGGALTVLGGDAHC